MLLLAIIVLGGTGCSERVSPSAQVASQQPDQVVCPDGQTRADSLDECAPDIEEPPAPCPAGEMRDETGECAEENCPDGTVLAETGECENQIELCADGSPMPEDGECAPSAPPPPEPMLIDELSPAAGPLEGGTVVTVTGDRFIRPTTVMVGAHIIDIDPVRSATELRFETPAADLPGGVDITISNDNGTVVLGNSFTYYENIAVTGVEPSRGPAHGGQEVTLEGAGFVEGTVVTFGGRAAARVEVNSSGVLVAVTPVGRPGPVDVRIFTENGEAFFEDGYAYFDNVDLTSVTPNIGPTDGDTIITLNGHGFLSGSIVSIGLDEADVLGVSGDGNSLTARPPPGEEGAQDVRITNDNGTALLPGAFSYFDPDSPEVRVFAVVPAQGSTSGDQPVQVVGNNFDEATVVWFGGEEAQCTRVDSHRLECRTPARPSCNAAEGCAVDVRVENAQGQDTLAGGFRYRLPLEIQVVSPASGPVGGGTRVTVRGTGFTPGIRLQVGVLDASDIQVLNDSTIMATTPPGSAGPADITVSRDDVIAVAHRAFSYTGSLRLLAVEPGVGAMAGGTYVTVLGTGFVPGSRLTFGGISATEVEVLNGASMTARTPAGSVGDVDVILTTPSGESWTVEDGFTYFNPTSRYGGTWGGPVEGSVNLTVLNGGSGQPVAEAYAMLGTDRDTPYQGLTDARGQITFSGPDLFGPQIITATKETFTSTSIVAFDAENVTVYISPPPSPASPNMGPGVPPARISGVVWGLDKYIKPFIDPDSNEVPVAYVSTTTTGIYEDDRPDPGPGHVVFGDGGEYIIDSRLGDIAAIGIGGILNRDTGEFRPMRMGAHRFIFGISDELAEGCNIELNIPMNQVAEMRFDNPPVNLNGGPDIMTVEPHIMFETEGTWPLHQYISYVGDPMPAGLNLANMPAMSNALDGLTFTIISGMWTLDPADNSLGLAKAENYAREIDSLVEPLDISPWVGVPVQVDPVPMGQILNQRVAWSLEGGSHLPSGQYNILFKFTPMGAVPVWHMYVRGDISEVRLPNLQDVNELPEGEPMAFMVIPVYIDGFHIDHFEYNDISVNNFHAWSQDYDILTY